ncbi:hypothetical protein ACFQU7_06585 [Pseudoroseomonas wenyumeiae]
MVIHLSEIEQRSPSAAAHPDFLRYAIPESLRGVVKVINTVVERGVEPVRQRVEEILACRRILSTSLHALVVAEAYGIPCAGFDIHSGPSGWFHAEDHAVHIDHRMRDFYAGVGRPYVLLYRNERHLPTDWEDACGFIEQHWQPLSYDPSRLLEAFPRHLGTLEAMPRPEVMQRLSSLAPLDQA